ncbi:amino acid ABC transporter permease [Siccirubricoccus sp. KC 17139]|uniref:Amino acid ABC transporter permease n=1 Tax=Siccirubricoccus soli TaxID=2899147 RepID=A0ABT1CYQ0_9PROT|nr:amino acid ABC transporter permease [Siccirubricoccus soli]MCO6414781.1 amino acid ABC transporter permease [Siccirubricoccus soli]MCP2680911.1 amino acid ABC transporter permease [Siccirubricoccus soli]
MSDAAIDPRSLRAPPKRPIRLSWSDERVRAIVWQVLVVGVIGFILWWLWSNTVHNLEVRRIATGFGFLGREAGLPIAEHVIDYSPTDTYFRALLVGLLNTLKVAVIGIVLATILGTLIGVARLSKNWLLAKLAAVYVEVIRDLPLLLQLLFWYAILQGLPGPRQALHPAAGVFLSNRGLKLPWIEWQDAHSFALLACLLGAVITWLYRRAVLARQMQDGQPRRVWPVALGLMLVLPIGVWFAAGAPWAVDWPELRGFNFRGGLTVSPEYFALLLGLVMYTAGFIAEIVRAGILAVPQGQWEAAQALGLHPGQVLRQIVLPQALRVIVPPMTSQYLNITKNSSLAVAIGYQDIVSIANTTLNQTGQAIEGIAIIMLVYLSISLSISLFMNWYNARIALVER